MSEMMDPKQIETWRGRLTLLGVFNGRVFLASPGDSQFREVADNDFDYPDDDDDVRPDHIVTKE